MIYSFFWLVTSDSLPPVQDSAVYKPLSRTSLLGTLSRKFLFDSFQASFFLSTSQRQFANQQGFLQILDRVSLNVAIKDDHIKLMTRKSAYSNQEWNVALRHFHTSEKVNKHNMQKLTSLHVLVAKIVARRKNITALQAPAENGQGKGFVIPLAIGSLVMLRTNLWTKKGLVNIAWGTVKDIPYEAEQSPPGDMPLVVMIIFDSSVGRFWPGTDLSPVTAVTRHFTLKGNPCTLT